YALLAIPLGNHRAGDADGEGRLVRPSHESNDARREILAEVVGSVRASSTPVPLEALAERAVRALGHEKTIGTGWAGAGSFRELFRQQLPGADRPSHEPPHLAVGRQPPAP